MAPVAVGLEVQQLHSTARDGESSTGSVVMDSSDDDIVFCGSAASSERVTRARRRWRGGAKQIGSTVSGFVGGTEEAVVSGFLGCLIVS